MPKQSAKSQLVTVFWFRRDLRLHDNVGLDEALKSAHPVLPLFIFDTEILEKLNDRADRRVEFIHQAVTQLRAELEAKGSSLWVEHGRPLEVFERLAKKFKVAAVYLNHDYEPSAIERDDEIRKFVEARGGEYHSFKDQVIFEKGQVCKDDGSPYSVFTPYMKKWKSRLASEDLSSRTMKGLPERLIRVRQEKGQQRNSIEGREFVDGSPIDRADGFSNSPPPMPTLAELGFKATGSEFPSAKPDERVLKIYDKQRDIPAIRGTSHLGVHLRFGTVSIREIVRLARRTNETWLSELIWREFFMQILANHPRVVREPFRPEFAKIRWRDSERDFDRWCKGETGIGIVDAGMRELNATGFMHNRVRMITASFLVKQLLIDWRRGEQYFAKKLLDFELASNNGNWQWVAGCGCDAAPYFRVFNPEIQAKKFDPKGAYVGRWVPERDRADYEPIVDLTTARVRALRAYEAVRS